MIVVKLLSDKGELDTVAGRVTLGVLLMQDVLAIVILAVQPNIINPALLPLGLSVVKGFALVAGTMLVSRFVLPFLFRSVAKLPGGPPDRRDLLVLPGLLRWPCWPTSRSRWAP